MKTKVAINGFGRIGRAALRIMLERDDVEVVAINDLTDNATLAHLLKYDSVFRSYDKSVVVTGETITIDDVPIPALSQPDPAQLPWKELSVDIVLECTGRFVKDGASQAHLDAGAKRVVLSAPAKGDDTQTSTHVIGVSDPAPESHAIISNASCTTNCTAPVAKIINDHFGIEKGFMTTVHSYTATQNLQDGPDKDMRKARAAAVNMIPTTTGAAIAVAKVVPEIAGKFDGLAIRVPTINVSLTDSTFVTTKDVTVEELNAAFVTAASGEMSGVLGVTNEPLVSSDFIGDPRSSIVDLSFTKVIGGNLIKVLAWYDNEWGYANRLVDTTVKVGKMMH